MNFFRGLRKSVKAAGMGGAIFAIVGLVVGLYVAAAVLPDAIVDITCSTSYAGAPAAVITLATTVVGIIAVVALIMIILKRVR